MSGAIGAGLGRLPRPLRTPALVLGSLLATFAVLQVLDLVLPQGAPLGIVVRGIVFGSLNGLIAIGIVLVYRANKVVNFAQADFGAVAAVLAIEFVLQLRMNYFLAIFLGFVIALALGALIERLVIRRFRNAPRLILAVATIGLSQVLNGVSILIPLLWTGLSSGSFTTPFSFTFVVKPVVFNGNHLVAIIAVVIAVAALTAFLRYTDYGIAIRAAAENGDRANLLGVPTARLSTMVWAIAGLLSAMAVILRTPLLGFSSFTSVSGSGFALLLITLAAAVFGGMESLPVTFLAAVGLGIVQELGAWTFHTATYVDALLLGAILIVLLLRRDRFSRATETGIATFKALREVRPIPSELRGTWEVRAGLVLLKGAFIGAALALPVFLEPSQEQLAALIFIYAIVAVSLVVLTGWGGQISLGHFALTGFGAATTGYVLTTLHWDLFLAIPIAMAVAALAAFLVGLPALRITGPFLAVTTLAFAVTSGSLFLNHKYVKFLPDFVPRPALWGRVDISQDWQMYYVSLFALIVAMAVARSFRQSRTGRALVGTRDNFQAAQSFSINTTIVKLTGFAVSGAIAGLAGSVYVLHQTAFKSDAFGPDVSIRLFSMVVIGGLGSLPGAFLGAAYVRGAEFFLPAGWSIIASGAGIVALLLFLPGGLGELSYRIRDRFLRWVARRHDILVPSLVADLRLTEDQAPVALGEALASLSEAGHAAATEKTTPDGRVEATNGHASAGTRDHAAASSGREDLEVVR